ncbi:MAG: hypothetical protein RLZ98_81 [Pseudomonadota bacterium]
MSIEQGVLILSEDAYITGEVQRSRRIEVHGYIDGKVSSDMVVVHEGGRVYGTLKAGAAEISGDLQGDISVVNLLDIRASGSVAGNVKYGQLAMQPGGNLSADLRNVPPALAGDLELSVGRGGSVVVTTVDLTAIDPDNTAKDLTFTVSEETAGFVALASAPALKVQTFTQAELEGRKVTFVHDGSAGSSASFKVVVMDAAGATSGKAQTVFVRVR